MDLEIRNEPDRQRFVAVVEGEECVVEYHLEGNVITFTHTLVPPRLGGRGIAGALTRHVLDTARTQGWKVVPECSYIAAWIDKHPEYRALLA